MCFVSRTQGCTCCYSYCRNGPSVNTGSRETGRYHPSLPTRTIHPRLPLKTDRGDPRRSGSARSPSSRSSPTVGSQGPGTSGRVGPQPGRRVVRIPASLPRLAGDATQRPPEGRDRLVPSGPVKHVLPVPIPPGRRSDYRRHRDPALGRTPEVTTDAK